MFLSCEACRHFRGRDTCTPALLHVRVSSKEGASYLNLYTYCTSRCGSKIRRAWLQTVSPSLDVASFGKNAPLSNARGSLSI